MKAINTDIDIDVFDRDSILNGVKHVCACVSTEPPFTKHNTGVYFQNIPRDPFTNISTIEYTEAEQLGYIKIDILNNTIYGGVKNEAHLVRLMNTEPMWELLLHSEFLRQLHHIGKYDRLVKKFKPTSIDHLAMLLAIIRPAKAHLQQCKSWDEVRETVWEREGDMDGYQFKKSHAYSYAQSIMVQMNIIVEMLNLPSDQ